MGGGCTRDARCARRACVSGDGAHVAYALGVCGVLARALLELFERLTLRLVELRRARARAALVLPANRVVFGEVEKVRKLVEGQPVRRARPSVPEGSDQHVP